MEFLFHAVRNINGMRSKLGNGFMLYAHISDGALGNDVYDNDLIFFFFFYLYRKFKHAICLRARSRAPTDTIEINNEVPDDGPNVCE